MSETAQIKQLVNKYDEKIYPITIAEAVLNGSQTIEQDILSINQSITNIYKLLDTNSDGTSSSEGVIATNYITNSDRNLNAHFYTDNDHTYLNNKTETAVVSSIKIEGANGIDVSGHGLGTSIIIDGSALQNQISSITLPAFEPTGSANQGIYINENGEFAVCNQISYSFKQTGDTLTITDQFGSQTTYTPTTFTLSNATTDNLGGIKLFDTDVTWNNSAECMVQLDDEGRAYVNVSKYKPEIPRATSEGNTIVFGIVAGHGEPDSDQHEKCIIKDGVVYQNKQKKIPFETLNGDTLYSNKVYQTSVDSDTHFTLQKNEDYNDDDLHIYHIFITNEGVENITISFSSSISFTNGSLPVLPPNKTLEVSILSNYACWNLY